MEISIHNIDSLAILITVLGYVVVFIALALLVMVFLRIKKVQDFFVLKKWKKKKRPDVQEELPKPEISGDVNAAISTALYLFFNEMHDEEKYVMTIRKVSRNYSPWSSKIYGTYNALKQKK